MDRDDVLPRAKVLGDQKETSRSESRRAPRPTMLDIGAGAVLVGWWGGSQRKNTWGNDDEALEEV